jgi:hypothetical protein
MKRMSSSERSNFVKSVLTSATKIFPENDKENGETDMSKRRTLNEIQN